MFLKYGLVLIVIYLYSFIELVFFVDRGFCVFYVNFCLILFLEGIVFDFVFYFGETY